MKRIFNILMFLFISIGITVLLFHARDSFGADWYIDKAATGSNNGTSWDNAWVSFSNINWSSFASGDTLYLSGGTNGMTYNERLVIVWNGNSEQTRIFIRPGQDYGHNGMVTISNPNGVGVQMGDDSGHMGAYVTIDGQYNGKGNMSISGNRDQGIYVRYIGTNGNQYKYLDISGNGSTSNAGHGITLNQNGTNIEIANCFIHDNRNDGVNQNGTVVTSFGQIVIHDTIFRANKEDDIDISGGVDVYNCILDGVGDIPTYHPDGIQASSGYWRIYNNYFHDHTQEIFFESIKDYMSNIYIYNNVIYDIDNTSNSPGVIMRAKLPNPGNITWDNIQILNNDFVDLKSGAVRFFADNTSQTLNITNASISNNIFYNCIGNTNLGLNKYDPSSLKVESNIFYGTKTIKYLGVIYSDADSFNKEFGFIGNTNIPPALINYSAQNFNLSFTDMSATGKGINFVSFFNYDGDYRSRPGSGFPWSIGAFENLATAPKSPGAIMIK